MKSRPNARPARKQKPSDARARPPGNRRSAKVCCRPPSAGKMHAVPRRGRAYSELVAKAPPELRDERAGTMTDKPPKTRTELEALVLAELRAAPQCGDAVHVTVVAYDDY